ncbi:MULTISPECIES: ABC transporter permease [Bacillaceae]|uniref:ABC transporter permease n=1 Tax=Bacillaceae TaxID=186817 RepID=UPI000BFD3006|nr:MULTISPECIES: ABC transporter permease [Bacillaceae]PGT81304.1 permease [Bacillus sp. AFS040349]UGB32894.1 ABC transporter permease [Metabacillus sp. B2-18]
MILRLLRSDFKKLKVGMWILVFLGPIGIFGLTTLNYMLRYEYLLRQSDDRWMQLLQQINLFLAPALLLGAALLASLSANIEHETNAWKQLLALPISRVKVYCSKFIMISLLLFIPTILMFIGTWLFGSLYGWEQNIPFQEIAINSFYPYFAAMPILAIQLWFSVTSANQGTPLAVGIVGAVVSMYSYGGPEWLIWKWPLLKNKWDIPEISVLLGIIVGGVIFLISVIHFERKDVK